MNITKKAITVLLSITMLATIGCGSEEKKPAASAPVQKQELKYRVMPTATSDLFEAGVKPLLEKKGYKLTPVKIKDSIQREIALDEGNIDFHVDAHDAWIKAVNKSKGTHQIADGDVIAIPNDASNLARSYQLLERLGWIKLDEKKDKDHVTGKDIVSNPKNLKFQEMKGPSINAIKTDVAFIILRGSDAYNAKLDFNTVLFAESSDSMKDSMRIALCVAEKNKDTSWVKDIIAAYKSPEFKEFTKKNGTFWILPKYMQ